MLPHCSLEWEEIKAGEMVKSVNMETMEVGMEQQHGQAMENEGVLTVSMERTVLSK